MQSKLPLCAVLALITSFAQAQTYHLTALGDNTSVSAINDLGQVVGTDQVSTTNGQLPNPTPYLWSAGKTTLLGNGIRSASDINNLGQITGALGVSQYNVHAYLYSAGKVTDLDPSGSGSGSSGLAINNQGVVAGYYSPAETTGVNAAATFAKGHITDLGVALAPSDLSSAYAINDKGQTAGGGGYICGGTNCGFFESGGQVSYITALGGQGETFASGINNAGTVVGSTNITIGSDGSGTHAMSFSNGVVTDLMPNTGSASWSYATAINNAGIIVGNDDTGSFVYTAGQARQLNTMLDASGKGWTLSSVADVNNLGQIVGTGIDAHGNTRAFLLSPVPEPETGAMALAGLALVGGLWRRKRKPAHAT